LTGNQLVDISHLTLDGRRVAAGGVLVNHSMNVNIGPAIMVVGYTSMGISLEGSGACFVHQAWLGAVAPGGATPRDEATGTGIVLEDGQHDAMIEDVIIFSGLHGVRSGNGANRLHGVHAWNLAGKQGGIGIELGVKWKGASGGRVENCYLDYAPLLISNPGNLLVTSNLFLGSSTVVLRAASAGFAVRNVIVTNNEHHTGNSGNTSFVVDESAGSFGSVSDMVVENNQVPSPHLSPLIPHPSPLTLTSNSHPQRQRHGGREQPGATLTPHPSSLTPHPSPLTPHPWLR
jgi:hypothetical protein